MTPNPTIEPSGSHSLSDDALFSVLSDKRRRYTLHYLKQCGDQVSVQELARQVAAWENNKSIDELSSQERKRVYIALYQSHLSTMDEEGLIDYDPDQGTVTLSEAMESVDLYLEVVPDEDIPWSMFYTGLTVANTLLLILAWLNIQPFTAVPDLGWAAVMLVSFGVSGFVQHYYNRQMRLGDAGPPPELEQ